MSLCLPRATLLVTALAAALGASPTRADEVQEVRVHLALSRRPHGTEAERDRIRELEEAFLGLLAAKDAGELARDSWDGGFCVITITTRDARLAWVAIEAAARAYAPLAGSYAVLRAGPRAAEERIPLDPGLTPPR